MLTARRILLDASARRFRAKKIHMRVVAAIRWANARNSILQGQKQHAGHAAALQQADNNLRAVSLDWVEGISYPLYAIAANSDPIQELQSVTDAKAAHDLRTKDWHAGHWLAEDPSLTVLQHWITTQT